MAQAVKDLALYRQAKFICAVPSAPEKVFDLPRLLAGGVAKQLGLQDLTSGFDFARPKKAIKSSALAEKWNSWSDSGLRFAKPFRDHPAVIIVDDKYQSGVTIQFVASKLREAGAGPIYGLCAVKTWRDDDNI